MRRIKLIQKKYMRTILLTMSVATLIFMGITWMASEYWYIGLTVFFGALVATVIESKLFAKDGLMLIGKRKVLNFIPEDLDVVQEELRKKIFIVKELADSAEAEKLRMEALERVKKRGMKIKEYREKIFAQWRSVKSKNP